jgi:hypothetical protein
VIRTRYVSLAPTFTDGVMTEPELSRKSAL